MNLAPVTLDPWQEDQLVKTGITLNEGPEHYHATPGLSQSGLKNFCVTPAHYVVRKGADEETSSQRLGTLTHMAALEPQRFNTWVKQIPGHRGGALVKAQIQEAENAGYYVCKPEEFLEAQRMAQAMHAHPEASHLLSGGKPEVSLRWRDPETNVSLRCRLDYLRDDGIVTDLKTFANLTDENIRKQIVKMKYHWQSRFYLNGVNAVLGKKEKMFAHIFVDTETYGVRVVVLGDASLDKADQEMRPLIDTYANCLRANVWPGYPSGVTTLELPDWSW